MLRVCLLVCLFDNNRKKEKKWNWYQMRPKVEIFDVRKFDFVGKGWL